MKSKTPTIVITGAAGFIGLELTKQVLRTTDYNILAIDAFTEVANEKELYLLSNQNHERLTVAHQRIEDLSSFWRNMMDKLSIDYVFNLAAETHVDNSNEDGSSFMSSNIIGTFTLVEYFRNRVKPIKCFFQISTDEVYGSCVNQYCKNEVGRTVKFKEGDKLNPTSYYASSKASAEHIVQSAGKVYNFPYIITRCCNNFGSTQNKEKLIPKIMYNLVKGIPFPLYSDGKQLRQWVSVQRHCACLLALMDESQKSDKVIDRIYNIGGYVFSNKEIIKMLATNLNIAYENIEFEVVPDRLAHDQAYHVDSSVLDSIIGGYSRSTFDNDFVTMFKEFKELYKGK
ncbi:NAD-dependent epimerase/dehydratase family protein [Candidatus Woesearchaeota archaeon]|jgi:dTDP-glucose 4,6-dehydratase|nr:NAD-dependent epimerase/dehydratase family protein [Candidatus Woesearchaeota archaeon]